MKPFVALVAASILGANYGQAVRIAQASQESWADLTVRNLNKALRAENYSVVLVGPTKHCTKSGATDRNPTRLRRACQFGSCPSRTRARHGYNESDKSLHWLNAHPQTCMRYAIDKLGPCYREWHGRRAQLAVVGPSGSLTAPLEYMWDSWSSTAWAAAWAARWGGVPAIAFGSPQDKRSFAWNATHTLPYTDIYPKLAAKLVKAVIYSGKPYLPEGVFLNVNFPPTTGGCDDPEKFKFVLTRRPVYHDLMGPRIDHCGRDRLPRDYIALRRENRCYVSVTATDSWYMETHRYASVHRTLIDKLAGFWHCLEENDDSDADGRWRGPKDQDT
ncbi:5'-nucleotidase [Purpureocillium takamizusanense]|uniref:5'-nucleotidase n=1 Tax=Purpureocillium takamizusanense TaxID=2060973 RepID=A0A9Q8QE64_9HYPO|nr:5'-nucleotidase [Purpureocillium takamizusanense]UNI17092.1 5'-nucleotidase [Purpureocillium takamizusanense]